MRSTVKLACGLFAAGIVAGALIPHAVPPAHACKCASGPIWTLTRVDLSGGGDLLAEEAVWPEAAWVHGDDAGNSGSLSFNEGGSLTWSRLP